jgi:hypothetical protein
LADIPVLLIATNRDDEVTHHQALDRVLPHLVREANAQRLSLAPPNEPAVQVLIERRYWLPEIDLARHGRPTPCRNCSQRRAFRGV